jgi:hypothetical protein
LRTENRSRHFETCKGRVRARRRWERLHAGKTRSLSLESWPPSFMLKLCP